MRLMMVLIAVIIVNVTGMAQDRLVSRNAGISFYSKTAIEDIEAHTQTAVSVLDKRTGQLEFNVLIKSFVFQKALMQEHFNENYMESDRFPKSSFKGRIDDLAKIDFTKDGSYSVSINGQLTIHGQTKPVNAPASFTIMNGSALAQAEFNITLSDYNISIPTLVKDKISGTVKIALKAQYAPLVQP